MFRDGSQWRKWDLHIHSTASDGALSPKEIVDIASEKGLSVIALTDHHTVRNLDETKKLGREKGITVISGIEFRTEYGAQSVHIIGLLPDEYDGCELTQNAIEDLILDKLNLSRTRIENEGRKSDSSLNGDSAFKAGMHLVQVSLKETADLIHQYGGLVSVHAGNKSNSIEGMRHAGNGARNVKELEDSLGTVKTELLRDYIDICELGSYNSRDAEFYTSNMKPVIVASDAHDRTRLGSFYSWIKADPTFEGLRQIIYEPEQRVCLKELKPDMKQGYYVIESVSINHPDFGEQEILLNQNLNAIIGGRSSGKSLLLGAIARLANYAGIIKEKEGYDDYVKTIVDSMKLTWRDHNESDTRKVEFFPQSYINKLATDSAGTIEIVERILREDDERRAALEEFTLTISKRKTDIALKIENSKRLKSQLQNVIDELLFKGDIEGVIAEKKSLAVQISKLKESLPNALTEDQEKDYAALAEERQMLIENNNGLEDAKKQLSQLREETLIKDIRARFVTLPESIKDVFDQKFDLMAIALKKEWTEFVDAELSKCDIRILENRNRISDIEKSNCYTIGESFFKQNDALIKLNETLELEMGKEKRIIELQESKRALQKALDDEKTAIISAMTALKSDTDGICKRMFLEKDGIVIAPTVVFDSQNYMRFIDENLNKRLATVKPFLEVKFDTVEQLGAILSDMIERIDTDVILVKNGLTKDMAIESLYNTSLFRLEYSINFQGDGLDLMSEGKKAFVILKMLLDFSDSHCPILIDQPEDDLDNRSIYSDLVAYLKQKKVERQIILVTHNPNIVLGADAEEVIVANQHGVHNENRNGVKFEYCSGSIENSFSDGGEYVLNRQGIREHICEILEGGDVAFLKREHKYNLKQVNEA